MPVEPAAGPITLLYIDQDLLVVDKPAGISSQPDKSGSDDLISRLDRQLGLRPGSLLPVHRLDRPVSGLLLLARKPAVQTDLTRQLSGHLLAKTYHAVVCGVPEPAAGELADYLFKNERLNLTQVAGPEKKAARIAVLSYQTVGQATGQDGQPLALLRIELKTGRHHQIRVQLAHAGWPLWGDTKYNPALHHAGGWHELALCATSLSFRHPATHQSMAFSRELPAAYPFSCFAASCS